MKNKFNKNKFKKSRKGKDEENENDEKNESQKVKKKIQKYKEKKQFFGKKQPLVEKEKMKTKITLASLDNFDNFINIDKSRIERIKKRTISKIILDRDIVKKSIFSLYNHHKKTRNPNDSIYLEIQVNQVPNEIPLRSFPL